MAYAYCLTDITHSYRHSALPVQLETPLRGAGVQRVSIRNVPRWTSVLAEHANAARQHIPCLCHLFQIFQTSLAYASWVDIQLVRGGSVQQGIQRQTGVSAM